MAGLPATRLGDARGLEYRCRPSGFCHARHSPTNPCPSIGFPPGRRQPTTSHSPSAGLPTLRHYRDRRGYGERGGRMKCQGPRSALASTDRRTACAQTRGHAAANDRATPRDLPRGAGTASLGRASRRKDRRHTRCPRGRQAACTAAEIQDLSYALPLAEIRGCRALPADCALIAQGVRADSCTVPFVISKQASHCPES